MEEVVSGHPHLTFLLQPKPQPFPHLHQPTQRKICESPPGIFSISGLAGRCRGHGGRPAADAATISRKSVDRKRTLLPVCQFQTHPPLISRFSDGSLWSMIKLDCVINNLLIYFCLIWLPDVYMFLHFVSL